MPKAEHQRGRSMALYETILKLKDLDECCRFFDDLCTPTELRSLEQRFDVAVYLQQGLVYLDILEKTGASHHQPGPPGHAGQRRRRCDAGRHYPGGPGRAQSRS